MVHTGKRYSDVLHCFHADMHNNKGEAVRNERRLFECWYGPDKRTVHGMHDNYSKLTHRDMKLGWEEPHHAN